MPDGGKDVEDFLDVNLSHDHLIKLNNSLIKLLSNGIVPMNKLHIYHCDIKDSNVLVQEQNNSMHTRLIDWGLSTEYNKQHSIPDVLARRPLQFNVPFSIILFTSEFTEYYAKFLKTYETINYYMIREFVINYIFAWIDIRGKGHLKLINETISILFKNELPVIDKKKRKTFIIYEFTYYYIIEYLSKILEKYTYNNSFHLYDYFNEVFIKNIDIWGFVMIYLPVLEKLYNKYDIMTKSEKELFKSLKYIIVHFLFESPVVPINVSELTRALKKLNIS